MVRRQEQERGARGQKGGGRERGPQTNGPRLLDIRGAAHELGVTERWMRRAVAERRLPFIKVGKLVRFDPVDITAYVRAHRVSENE